MWDGSQSEVAIFFPNYAMYRVMFTGGGSPNAVGVSVSIDFV